MLFKLFKRANPICSITEYIRKETGLENARIMLHPDDRYFMGIIRRPFGKIPHFVMTTGFYNKMHESLKNNFSKKEDALIKRMFDASAAHETGHWMNKDLDKMFFLTKKWMHNAEYNADAFAVKRGHEQGLKEVLWYASSLNDSPEHHYTESITHPSLDNRLVAIDKTVSQLKKENTFKNLLLPI